jgi:hypothetical protein
MKNIYRTMQLGLVAAVAIFTTSCSREGLDDVMSNETFAGVKISVDPKAEIGANSNFTLTGGELTVPVTLKFSSATTRAFTLNVTASSDNVPQLVSSGVLPTGTVAVPASSFNILGTAQVPIGVTSYSVNLIISRTFIEVNYGKNIAVAVQVSNPAKDNAVVETQNTVVVLVKTADVMSATSVHDIYVGAPGATSNIFAIPSPGSYDINSEILTFRVPISIQGDLGTAFTISAVSSPDSVRKYIASGKLTNAELYSGSRFSLSTPTVSFDANSRTSYITFTTKRDTLLKMQPAPGAATIKKPTVAFTIKNPSKFQVKAGMNTVYVTLDPNFFRPYYGSYFVIKGAIGAVSDPIYAAYYDFGGVNIAWWDNNSYKDGDANWRFPDWVDVSADYNPRTAIGWVGKNEWVSFTTNVEESGTYQMDLYFGASNGDGRYTAFMDNVPLLNGIQVAQNTGGHNNQKAHPHTVTLTKGVHIFKVFCNDGNSDYRGAIFTRKS